MAPSFKISMDNLIKLILRSLHCLSYPLRLSLSLSLSVSLSVSVSLSLCISLCLSVSVSVSVSLSVSLSLSLSLSLAKCRTSCGLWPGPRFMKDGWHSIVLQIQAPLRWDPHLCPEERTLFKAVMGKVLTAQNAALGGLLPVHSISFHCL